MIRKSMGFINYVSKLCMVISSLIKFLTDKPRMIMFGSTKLEVGMVGQESKTPELSQ